MGLSTTSSEICGIDRVGGLSALALVAACAPCLWAFSQVPGLALPLPWCRLHGRKVWGRHHQRTVRLTDQPLAVCVCVHVCAHVCAHVCLHVCVHVCVLWCVCVCFLCLCVHVCVLWCVCGDAVNKSQQWVCLGPSSGPVRYVNVLSADESLDLNTDESYTVRTSLLPACLPACWLAQLLLLAAGCSLFCRPCGPW